MEPNNIKKDLTPIRRDDPEDIPLEFSRRFNSEHAVELLSHDAEDFLMTELEDHYTLDDGEYWDD